MIGETGLGVRLNLAVDDERWDLNEDTHEGTTYKFKCPPGCLYSQSFNMLDIAWYYADTVPLCAAAAHSGVIRDAEGAISWSTPNTCGIAPHAFDDLGGSVDATCAVAVTYFVCSDHRLHDPTSAPQPPRRDRRRRPIP